MSRLKCGTGMEMSCCLSDILGNGMTNVDLLVVWKMWWRVQHVLEKPSANWTKREQMIIHVLRDFEHRNSGKEAWEKTPEGRLADLLGISQSLHFPAWRKRRIMKLRSAEEGNSLKVMN